VFFFLVERRREDVELVEVCYSESGRPHLPDDVPTRAGFRLGEFDEHARRPVTALWATNWAKGFG